MNPPPRAAPSPRTAAAKSRVLWPTLPARPDHAHKRSSGSVVVIGGADTMVGAPVFVALAALRTGCGFVRLAVPNTIRSACLTLVPSAIAIATDPQGRWLTSLSDDAVIVFGPGLADPTAAAPRRWLATLIARGHRLVIDGGGLHTLTGLGTRHLQPGQAVLTPHPGEYARLATAFRLPALEASPPARLRAAKALAEICHGAVVFKGPGTVITNGRQSFIDDLGGPELAIPGSGDVLTGIISALRAHDLDHVDAAALGVRLHSRAGRIWKHNNEVEGLLAPDLAALIPAALAEHRRARR